MPDLTHHIEEAFEIYGYPSQAPFIFSCEHASNRIPLPLQTNPQDRALLQTHWGWDIGTRDLIMELSRRTKSVAVMARFSRLLCDANRHRNRSDLIKPDIEGQPLSFNQHVDEIEAVRRIDHYHEPYHQAIDSAITQRKDHPAPFLFLSIHSFTPVWNDKVRTMDIGILYRLYPQLAEKVRQLLTEEQLFVAMNEPYSAKFGLMYAADRHGEGHNILHLELEINQSVLCTPQRVLFMADKIERCLIRLMSEPRGFANFKS